MWGPGGPRGVFSSSQGWTQSGERGLGKDAPLARPSRPGAGVQEAQACPSGDFPGWWPVSLPVLNEVARTRQVCMAVARRKLVDVAFSASLRPRSTGLTPVWQQVSEYQLRAGAPRVSDPLFHLGLPSALCSPAPVSILRQPRSPCSKSLLLACPGLYSGSRAPSCAAGLPIALSSHHNLAMEMAPFSETKLCFQSQLRLRLPPGLP